MITELLPRDGLIACAVSGGTDSMYLLCRLCELGYAVAAAHYNHGLRGAESDRDERFVLDFCRERGIPALSEKGNAAAYGAEHRLCTEDAARQLRYDFLSRAADTLGASVIATAHNADDNAETVIMNLVRGAGARGLSGIPPVRGSIVRPMLDVTRAEAADYLEKRGIPHVEDSSNNSDDMTRNRLRHHVIPVLREINPELSAAAARTTELLRRDEQYLTGLAEDFLREYARGDILSAKALTAAPWSVSSRAVRLMAGRELSAEHTEAVLRTARDGGFADIPGMRVGKNGDDLVFGTAPAPPIHAITLSPGISAELTDTMSVSCRIYHVMPPVHNTLNKFFFQCDNICGNINITSRRPGDSFRPAGRGCTKTLKQLFLENHIPQWERDAVPVIRDGRGILAVCGIGTAEGVSAAPGDRNVIEIKFTRHEPDEGGNTHA